MCLKKHVVIVARVLLALPEKENGSALIAIKTDSRKILANEFFRC